MDFLEDRDDFELPLALCLRCSLTKYTVLLPVAATTTADDLSTLLYDGFWCWIGAPKHLTTDRDTKFMANTFQQLLKRVGTNNGEQPLRSDWPPTTTKR